MELYEIKIIELQNKDRYDIYDDEINGIKLYCKY